MTRTFETLLPYFLLSQFKFLLAGPLFKSVKRGLDPTSAFTFGFTACLFVGVEGDDKKDDDDDDIEGERGELEGNLDKGWSPNICECSDDDDEDCGNGDKDGDSGNEGVAKSPLFSGVDVLFESV